MLKILWPETSNGHLSRITFNRNVHQTLPEKPSEKRPEKLRQTTLTAPLPKNFPKNVPKNEFIEIANGVLSF